MLCARTHRLNLPPSAAVGEPRKAGDLFFFVLENVKKSDESMWNNRIGQF